MAFEVKRINPLDLQPRKAVGVSLPFSSNSVFNSTYTTKDALKSNLINHFLTDTGERYLNSTLGAGLRRILFDQMTDDKQEEIYYIITTGLSKWFPTLQVDNLSINPFPDENRIEIALRYSVSQTNISDELVINFE